METKSDRRIYR